MFSFTSNSLTTNTSPSDRYSDDQFSVIEVSTLLLGSRTLGSAPGHLCDTASDLVTRVRMDPDVSENIIASTLKIFVATSAAYYVTASDAFNAHKTLLYSITIMRTIVSNFNDTFQLAF